MNDGVVDSPRAISVRLLLEGGHSELVQLTEDSAELRDLFQILGTRSSPEQVQEKLFQLPLDGGREAFSFHSSQLVSIATRPPVLVELQQSVEPEAVSYLEDAGQTDGSVNHPESLVIDNFLSPDEHRDMLAYALQSKEQFNAGTTGSGPGNARENLVILDFAQHPHSRLLCNRLLTCFPAFLQKLKLPAFPVQQLESQLTACNDGHYYQTHLDVEKFGDNGRALTCVYYFSAKPAQFTGGALRLYDDVVQGGQRVQGTGFQEIEAVPNRLVVFRSDSYHQLMPIRCPSRKFEDSRFAITNWFWQSPTPDAQASHGWGHLHCCIVPPGFVPTEAAPQ